MISNTDDRLKLNANAEADSQAAQKSEDSQQMFTDAVLGFAMIVGNAYTGLFLNLSNVISSGLVTCAAVVLIAFALVALCLKSFKHLTSKIQSVNGVRVSAFASGFSLLGSLACSIFEVYTLGMILPCLTLVFVIVIYAEILVSLSRDKLIFLINIMFMYTGISIVLLFTNPEYGLIIYACTVIVSLAFMGLHVYRFKPGNTEISAECSEKNNIRVKGNSTTLVLVGFMIGVGALIFKLASSFTVAVVIVGVSVLASSVISLVLDRVNERAYKDFMRKTMAAAVCLLLLVPFVPNTVQLAVLAGYMVYALINLNIVLSAIVETARFNLISLVWLAGNEGFVLVCGMGAGVLWLLFNALPIMSANVNALGIMLSLFCLLSAVLQTQINYLIYPFQPVFEEKEEPELIPEIESAGRHKALWQRKIERACELYRLSPREVEVLHILLKGRDAKYIMDKFVVSQSTAKTHIYNIYRKFDIHSRQELLDFIEDITVIDNGSLEAQVNTEENHS